MTSEEVLEICKKLYAERNTSLASAKESRDKCDEDMKHIWNDDIDYFQSQVDFYERIIQDLEILKLLKELLKSAKVLKKNEIDISKYVAIITDSTSEILKEWMKEC